MKLVTTERKLRQKAVVLGVMGKTIQGIVMRFIGLLSLVLSLAVVVHAQDGRFDNGKTDQILTSVERPAGFAVNHQASFVRVDDMQFMRAYSLPVDGTVRMTLQLPGTGSVVAELRRYRVFDEASLLVAMTENGPVKYAAPTSILLRGTITSIPGSFVMMAIYPNWATGHIDLGEKRDHQEYLISPLSIEERGSTMIIYDRSHVQQNNPWSCHTEEPSGIRIKQPKESDEVQARYRIITVALEGDEPYYIDHGRNLAKATQYAESVVAAASAIYERDITATIRIGQLYIWQTADPYPGTNSTNLLTQFRDRWRTNYAGVNRTLAHLLSGVNSIGGIAYLNALCSKDIGYAVSGLNNNITYPAAGYVWDTDVFSHETGHNVGSPHTFNCGWNPPIDSCVAAEGGTCYTGTKAVKGTIMSYCHLTSQGTNLNFNTRVSAYMKTFLTNDACTPLTYELTVTLNDSARACYGSVATVSAVANAGAEPYSYRWQGPGFDTVTTNSTFNFIVTSNFLLRLTVSDDVGNTAIDSCVVRVKPAPVASIEASAVKVCQGTTVDLTCVPTKGLPPFNYQWLRNGLTMNNPTEFVSQRVDQTTTYQAIVSDSTGCSDTAEITIKTYDLRAAIDPTSFALPALPTCVNVASKTYAIQNIGADTIVIDSIVTGSMIEAKAALPVVLAPGAKAAITVSVTVKGTGTIRDDVVFMDKRCNWRFRTTVTGTRLVAKVFTKVPVDLGTKIACDTPTVRTVYVGINNPTPFPMQVAEVYSSTVGTVATLDGTFTIPPGTDKTVSVSILPKMNTSSTVDTLSLVYLSEGCEGVFTVPLTIREAKLNLAYPSAVAFDTVRTSQQLVNKTISITATLTGTQRTTVADVRITEPYTTTMQPGLILAHNKATPVTVSLAPSALTKDGAVNGTLEFSLDSCLTSYKIDLTATNVVVGIQENAGGAFAIHVDDGTISVAAQEGIAMVYDTRGGLVGRVSISAQESGIRREMARDLPSGCYVVIYSDSQRGSQLARTVIIYR